MEKEKIYYLLSRYEKRTITEEEKEKLKFLLNIANEDELSDCLVDMWDKYQPREEVNPIILEEMYGRIKQKTIVSTTRLTLYKMLRVASILLIPLLGALSVYLYLSSFQDHNIEDREMLVQASKGQQAEVVLYDGTRVRLNAGSTLKYNQRFGIDHRKVSFTGEAYFEVTKDDHIPFIVHTKELDVEVLGTSFNLYSYLDDNIVEMALVSGRVKVTTNTTPARIAYLKPNEKVLFDKQTRGLQVIKTDNSFETAWLKGALVFRSVPLKEVITKLERRYGVEIHLDDSTIQKDIFSGSFNSEQVREVMKILQTHYSFTYKIENDHIYITSTHK